MPPRKDNDVGVAFPGCRIFGNDDGFFTSKLFMEKMKHDSTPDMLGCLFSRATSALPNIKSTSEPLAVRQ
jgi:hypothetical protein